MDITFEFEGVQYVVGGDAYHGNKIILPDGRRLSVAWLETNPPQPGDLRVVDRSRFGSIARRVDEKRAKE